MMGNPIMMRMIFALIDTDGDGAISLQEFQAAHDGSPPPTTVRPN
jgi:hypothetical protein